MIRQTSTLLTLSLVLFGAGLTSADDAYVRYETGETARDAALQTAVATFRHADSDVELVLYGVVHVADADYYARVQADLDSYTTVLYEGVAPSADGAEPDASAKSLGELQKAMGEMLGMSFQKDGIDYTRPNLVHADMTMDQLQEAMGGGSVNPLGQFMDKDQLESMAPFMRMIAGIGKTLMKNNPQMRDQFKARMAQQLGTADLEGQLGEQAHQAILIDRNVVVMEKLAEQLEVQADGSVAIFYGAAHHPDFEQRLAALGWEITGKRWMSAWTIGGGVGDSAEEAPTAPETPAEPETVPPSETDEPRWF